APVTATDAMYSAPPFLHDALPISNPDKARAHYHRRRARKANAFTEPHTHEDLIVFTRDYLGLDPDRCFYCLLDGRDSPAEEIDQDRKSTRLNSSHVKISYAVFCLK